MVMAARSRAIAPTIAPDDATPAPPGWTLVELPDGAIVGRQGEPTDAFAVLEAGELELALDGRRLGAVRAPSTLGEPLLFSRRPPQLTSLRARGPVRLSLLGADPLGELRAAGGAPYESLLRRAIAGAGERGAYFDRRLAQVRQGGFAAPPPPERPGPFTRLWRRVARSRETPPPPPPLRDRLAEHPGLAYAAPTTLSALADAFTPTYFHAGDVIIRQGDHDPRILILASGHADILRTIEDHGGALLLDRLGPGAITGINTFMGSSTRRTASVVATAPGWAYAMDPRALDRLPPPARIAWLELTLAVYVQQYAAAARRFLTAVGSFLPEIEALLPAGELAR